MKNNGTIIYNVFLILGDFLALVAAFVAAFIFRVTLGDAPITYPIYAATYLKIFASLLPFWILIFALLGLYSNTIYEKRFAEAGRLFLGSFIGLMFIIFWNFVSVDPIFPAKLIPFYGFGIGFVLLVLFRNIARAFRTMLFGYDIGITKILVVGNTQISDELRDNLEDSKTSGYKVLGVVGDKRRGFHADFASFEEALSHIPHYSIHGIIQTELYSDEERNRAILDYAQQHHISYRFIPGNTELFVGNIEVELFRNSMPVIAVRQTPLFGWGRVAKRLFDIIFGGLCLVVAAPFIIVTALCQKLAGRGDVFLRQTRLTRFDEEFKLYKFRTIKPQFNGMSPEEAFIKMGKPELIEPYRAGGDQIQNDPRFTRFGQFLRKTSLDELPQLFNVVKGDLSLVGPRALVPQELHGFQRHHIILSVKSGITGLAQVSGRRDIPFEERRKLDLYYVQNWSFWMDLVLLIKTIRVLLDRSGAR